MSAAAAAPRSFNRLSRPKSKKKKVSKPRSIRSRLAGVTLGDVGELAMGAWEGAAALLPWNTEVKRLDTVSTITCNPGSVSPLLLLGEGADFNQRVGHSVRLETLEFRLLFQGSGANAFDATRCVVFIDTESARGSAPAVTDVLEAATVNSLFQHDNLERFDVIHDFIVDADLFGRGIFHSKVFALKLGTHATWDGSGATIASVDRGQPYLLLISAQTSNQTSCLLVCRASFVDN